MLIVIVGKMVVFMKSLFGPIYKIMIRNKMTVKRRLCEMSNCLIVRKG
jgi:hypothetical protein